MIRSPAGLFGCTKFGSNASFNNTALESLFHAQRNLRLVPAKGDQIIRVNPEGLCDVEYIPGRNGPGNLQVIHELSSLDGELRNTDSVGIQHGRSHGHTAIAE